MPGEMRGQHGRQQHARATCRRQRAGMRARAHITRAMRGRCTHSARKAAGECGRQRTKSAGEKQQRAGVAEVTSEEGNLVCRRKKLAEGEEAEGKQQQP